MPGGHPALGPQYRLRKSSGTAISLREKDESFLLKFPDS
jgi:hypothetical protein